MNISDKRLIWSHPSPATKLLTPFIYKDFEHSLFLVYKLMSQVYDQSVVVCMHISFHFKTKVVIFKISAQWLTTLHFPPWCNLVKPRS